MEANIGNARALERRLEFPPHEVARVLYSALLVREDQVRVTLAARRHAMLEERLHDRGREPDSARRPSRFRLLNRPVPIDAPPDPEAAPLAIEVAPSEREELAAANARAYRGHDDEVRLAVFVVVERCEEPLHLFERERPHLLMLATRPLDSLGRVPRDVPPLHRATEHRAQRGDAVL